ncbi:MAG: hypothetical protein JO368_06955 [Acidimicrobiales bacterium]|nr:hypothetical protein [Acidimicrobiales bacterium]
MIRKVLSGAGALAVVLGGVLVAQSGVAGATKTPVTLSGSITCTAIGAVKFSPALVNGGTAPDTIKVLAKLASCSGSGASSGGVTLTGGTLKAASSSTTANSCGAILGGSSLPQLTGTVKWKGSGGSITESSVTITNATTVLNDNGNSGQGEVDVSLPTSVTAGSYSGEGAAFSGLTSNATGLSLDSKCGKAAGLRGVAFGKPGGTVSGSVTISAPGGGS